ncbi:MAG: glycine cleavage system protein GcvH [Ignavibacteriaceae bacterium]|jgi:glycine cleavage system H protein|nr:MAG: glycine cleavage system protein GcvH [Chlorobiota bacterium]KXK04595.1 MAG: glycine cleavage system H protein [Chlorobi bacterium OLB4]MBV6399541.1 Glycine cleavage system H protein [Ignavibacteria bacterium]MCC6886614.1 glycine cleavage system protein GcvH [Ignavibacteriales bacterium]MCE7953247.1 glycine cleavage system protein GcvH [Chlorobi bacterium CHB7]MEB2328970.1 glycine cleavage system protein GcvH [Ignavibacteriaceae bacterium]OQY76506.1 MAG: glycine cleavage system protein
MNIPSDLKYTKDHEWIRVEGDIATVGITDYAQNELGDIIFLDITSTLGDSIKAGVELGTIEAVKTVSEIISPADGLITGINEQINENPSVVNTDPYNEGWMVKIKLDNKFDRSSFLSDSEYKELIGI